MRSLRYVLYALWAIAFALGLVGVWQRLTGGHQYAAYGSYVVWGLWVASYIYFIGLSAGAFLLSAVVYVFGLEKLERIGKLALFTAVTSLGMALLSIWFDLGHMPRAYKVMTSPNFRSMMAWMIWLYSAYFLILLAETFFAIRDRQGDRQKVKTLATIGVPVAIAFHGGVGALFATLSARGYWHQPLYPILFLTGALASGAALLAAVAAFFWPRPDEAGHQEAVQFLGRTVLGLVLLDVILEWAEFSIPLWYGVSPERGVLMEVLTGPYWWVFWILHVLMGTVIPILLLTLGARSVRSVGIAGALVAMTFMAVRLNIVIPGQVEPELKGLERAFADPRLTFHYVPTVHEWLVVLFIVTLGLAVYWAGFRLLPLTAARPAAHVHLVADSAAKGAGMDD